MGREWSPDHTITLEAAARVIAERAPDLAGLPVRLLDSGWDNTVVGVGEEWLFRFVHRAVAVDGSRRELAVLGRLAGHGSPLPLAVPEPRVVGRTRAGTDGPGWPFWGALVLPGVELAVAGLGDEERSAVAAALGGFLRVLHHPATARLVADVDLPVDPIGRSDTAGVVVPRARARLSRLAGSGVLPPARALDDLLARAGRLGPPAATPVLVHGDLHVRHVLVAGPAASGIIDWGDTALADPCVDLMIGWAAFTGTARQAFLDAYGPVPPERELRARALAVGVHAALAEQAADGGHEALLAESLAAIRRAVR
ncbi:MAG TPA: phosphotransferase [Actinotalea sp.]|nr:phosphotransferase [Actinotalea sp.]